MLAIARWLAILLPVTLLAGPAVAEILVALIGALFLVHSFRARDWQWAKSPWMIALLLFWLELMFSTLHGRGFDVAVKESLPWIRYPLLLAALSVWVLPDAQTQRRVLLVLLVTVTFLSLDMLVQYYTGADLFGRPRFDLMTFSRLTGPFSGARAGITLVWIAFPALCFVQSRIAAQAHNGRKQLLQIGALLFAALFVWAAYLSGERMAFLLCSFGLVLMVLLVRGARLMSIALVLILLATVGLLSIAQPRIAERQLYQTRATVEGFAQSPYGSLMESAVHVWRDYPLLGTGRKGFRLHCPDPQYGPAAPADLARRCGLHPHNPYLETLAEEGVIGFLFYVFAITAIGAQCWLGRRLVFADAVLAGLVITYIIRIWPIMSVTSPFIPWSAAPFWFFTGLLLARLNARTNETA